VIGFISYIIIINDDLDNNSQFLEYCFLIICCAPFISYVMIIIYNLDNNLHFSLQKSNLAKKIKSL